MRRLATIVLVTAQLLIFSSAVKAQTVTATVPAGTNPQSVAVNPVTNKIYLANNSSNNVTVIDGATNTSTEVALPFATLAVAVNPVTNKIYVVPNGGANVDVIDGLTNSVTTVLANKTGPFALAVNPVTNKIYVANSGSGNVTVIDGATSSFTTVAAGSGPKAMAVNPVTNTIYVANQGDTINPSTVTVIDGTTNTTTTVAAGIYPFAVAVNPVTNKIYVANQVSNNVTVIDGATNSTTMVTVGTNPQSVAVNPVTNQIYVANISSANVTVIDGATNSTATVAVGSFPAAVAVNPVTNKIYVANAGSNNVTVIDGATNSISTVTAGTSPAAVGVNPVTNQIYVANISSNNVSVIDGATNPTATVAAGRVPQAVGANPVTNKIYVADGGSNDITVIDGTTEATTTVSDPNASQPRAVGINPITNKIYVANIASNNITVIDGATNATTTVSDSTALNPNALGVNPVTNKIYVANGFSDNVTVIDGATNLTTTVPVGGGPVAVAVNQATNKIYVANQLGNSVTVIDGATNGTTTVSVGTSPWNLAVNPVTNKIYVPNSDVSANTVTVIDGATNGTTPVTVGAGTIFAVGVNPVTNKIYVADTGGTVTVIDGANNATTTVSAGTSPQALAVNPVTNKIYVANNGSGNVTVIDGTTNFAASATAGTSPFAVAVNPVTNKIYVTNFGSSNVTAITEQVVQINPLLTVVTPLAGNTTSSPTPTFDFTGSSTFSPNATTPDNLLFQVDTWQGPWTEATNNGGGNFTGGAPVLQPGFHILYAYATDGQDATSVNTGQQSSPLIGNITAYGFLVTPPTTAPTFSSSPSPLAFGSELVGATTAPITVTVTNTGTANLTFGAVAVSVSGLNTADFTLTTDGCSNQTLGPTTGSCSVSATFTPSITGPETAALNFTDNAAGSPQAVNLTGTGALPTVTLLPASLTFNTTAIGATSAAQTVTLSNTGTVPLTITTISTNLSVFGETNTCGGSLAASSSCTISVTFTPNAIGVVAGTLSVSDNATGSPQNISLTGTGISLATDLLSQTSLTFGGQNVGTSSAPQTLTLTNSGTGPEGSITITTAAEFPQTNNCPAPPSTLAAGASCTINVIFKPVHLGALSGQLVVTDTSNNSPQSVNLSGIGLPVPFAKGDLFFSLGNGTVLRETPTGSLIQIMDTGTGSYTYGMAFDKAQNLYVSDFGGRNVSKFSNTGAPLGFFGSGYGGSVEDLAFNTAGDLIAGSVDGDNTIRIFDTTGAPLAQYVATPQNRGIDWFDLASDQCTLYYTSEGTSIKRFDICKGVQLADFVTNLPGSSAFALRFLPSGGLLVANSNAIERLDASGNIIQSYTATGASELFGLNLDPDGTSFWTGDYGTSDVYKFDIASGSLLLSFHVTDVVGGFGIAVNGEITVATAGQLTLSTTTLVLPGTHINQTCTPGVVTVTNSGTTPVAISSISVAAPYTQTNNCPASLGAGASCAVSVTFVPTVVANAQAGTLSIVSNAAGSPNTVALSANGLAACFLGANAAASAVIRTADTTTFTIAHQACSAAGPVQLSCSNQNPVSCSFSPSVLTSPDTPSILTVGNLNAVTGDGVKFEVHADATLEHLSTGLTIQIMDFLMASGPAAGTITAGQTTTYALAVEPQNGLQGTVAFSCSGAPTGATCTVTPQTVTLNGLTAANVTVNVSTTARSLAGPPNLRRVLPPSVPIGLMLLALVACLVGWTLAGMKQGTPKSAQLRLALYRPVRGLATLGTGLMVAAVLTWAACGGGGSMGPMSSSAAATPAGTYNLTVTGTFSATGTGTPVIHKTALTLTVR